MANATVSKLTIFKRKDNFGFFSYDLTHKGGWHHCVSVYPKVDWSTQKFEGYEINWSCWGNTSIEDTKEFAIALKRAVKIAERGNLRGGK